jgi:hypothetical protein
MKEELRPVYRSDRLAGIRSEAECLHELFTGFRAEA